MMRDTKTPIETDWNVQIIAHCWEEYAGGCICGGAGIFAILLYAGWEETPEEWLQIHVYGQCSKFSLLSRGEKMKDYRRISPEHMLCNRYDKKQAFKKKKDKEVDLREKQFASQTLIVSMAAWVSFVC